MRLIIRYSIGLALLLAVLMSASAAESRPPTLLFDEWGKGENGGGALREFKSWKSSGGHHVIQYMKSGEDTDVFVLVGKNLRNGQDVVLGHGVYGVGVKWMQTGAGEVAVIDHRISSGMNELFVIKPSGSSSWDKIYQTPDHWAPGGLVIDHCYWTVMSMDKSLGSLRLKCLWTYSNISNAAARKLRTDAVYNVPLFYGWQTAASNDKPSQKQELSGTSSDASSKDGK